MAYRLQIWKELEGLTYKNISRKTFGDLRTLGITGIVSHGKLYHPKTTQMDIDIDDFVAPPSHLRDEILVPFRSNTIYMYCQTTPYWRNSVTKQTCPLKPILNPPIDLTIIIPVDGGGTGDYTTFCPSEYVRNIADIIFSGPAGAAGWYNIEKNVMWLPDLSHEDINTYFAPVIEAVIAVKTRRTTLQTADTLTFGADPEFEMFDSSKQHVPANHIFSTEPRIPIGCDGLEATGEIRPRPSPSPLGVVRNIRRLCHTLASNPRLSGITITAGGGQIHHLGGHIHVNRYINKVDSFVLWDLVGKPVLDGMTGLRTQRNDLVLRDSAQAVRIPYNKDKQNHKGSEWRQLPSWIESEKAARAIMCTFAAVYKRQIEKPYDHLVTNNMGEEAKINTIRETPLYKWYGNYIDDFINLFYHKKYSMENKDIFPGWNISPRKNGTNISIISDKLSGIEKFFPTAYIKELSRPLNLSLLQNREDSTFLCILPKDLFDNKKIALAVLEVCERLTDQLLTTTSLLYHLDPSTIELRYPSNWKNCSRSTLAKRIAPFIKSFIKIIVKGG